WAKSGKSGRIRPTWMTAPGPVPIRDADVLAGPGRFPAGKVTTWLIFLAVYFALGALSRILISNSAELDEAEQLVLGQSFEWSYGAQMPCYTWLQKLVFAALGQNIAALALFKGALLFTEFSLVLLCVRQATGRTRSAVVGLMGMFLIPQFVWESQRD